MTHARRLLFVVPFILMFFAGCDKKCSTCSLPAVPSAPIETLVQVCLSATADASALAVCPGAVATGTGHGSAQSCTLVPKGQEDAFGVAEQKRLQAQADAQAKATAVCVSTPTPTPTPTPAPTPTPTPACTFTVQPTSQNFPYTGGSGRFAVIASRSDCTWSAVPDQPWVSITSGSPGIGNGSVTYVVAGNGGGARAASISGYYTVTQDAAPIINPPPTVTLSAAPASITVGQSSTLSWTSTNATSCSASGGWSGAQALSGNQNVAPGVTTTYTLTCNGPGGSATQSATVTVTPVNPTCVYQVQTTTQTFGSQGGNGGFSVSTNLPTCSWTAVSNVFWVGINSGASGTGNGSGTFTVGANAGASRTGTISVAGQSVTIVQ